MSDVTPINSLQSLPEYFERHPVPPHHLSSFKSWPPSSSLPSGQGGPRSRNEAVRLQTCKDPDSIVWGDTEKCTIRWNRAGGLGFSVRDIEGADKTESYAIISKVEDDSNARDTLQCGDRILSINGTAVHVITSGQKPTRKATTATILRKQSKSMPVTLVIQSPRRILQRKIRSDSAGAVVPSTKDPSPVLMPRHVVDDDAPMMRLPNLRLVILGPAADCTGEQLVGSEAWSLTEDGLISRRCSVMVQKQNMTCRWSATHMPTKEAIPEEMLSLSSTGNPRERHECQDGGGIPSSVTLEIMAIKSLPQAQYCSQALMTSHCQYIIQFDGQSFHDHPAKCMGEIQEQLDKIRTYAGESCPIYLVSTWQADACLTVDMIEDIGSHLQQRFSVVWSKQLQYHGNCPCFVLRLPKQSAPPMSSIDICEPSAAISPPGPGGSSVVYYKQSSNSTVASSSSSSSLLASMASSSTGFSDLGPEAFVTFLQEHISANAFRQSFIHSRYPRKFLRCRDLVLGMRSKRQRCVMTANIKQVCGLETDEELMSLLEFLHHQGVILSPGSRSDSSQPSFVVLNPEDTIKACQSLLAIPCASFQEPNLRADWTYLRTKAVLTDTLCRHLLGVDSDAECLIASLQWLNLIFTSEELRFSGPVYTVRQNSEKMAHFVPYLINSRRHSDDALRDFPHNDSVLLADFQGHCPHGAFTKIMLKLCRVANLRNGSCEVKSKTSWTFHIGGDYSLNVNLDPYGCLISFAVMCSMSFAEQNVLRDIYTAIQEVVTPGGSFILGPVCPLYPKCRTETMHLANPHVIDLKGGRVDCPPMCRNENLRNHSSVKKWIIPETREIQMGFPSQQRAILRWDTPISMLPEDVFQFICDELNTRSPLCHDWRGLAGVLGYTFKEVERFETASIIHYNPCRHLLRDWASRDSSSNLGSLRHALAHSTLKRLDILQQLGERWHIIDTH
ncbi:uncharacterized protein [Diadema setosum]|uniref:uncharacterized protein n=1 Tax=Diadema setosum TaxID=31175 RepID=UPI003B3A1172